MISELRFTRWITDYLGNFFIIWVHLRFNFFLGLTHEITSAVFIDDDSEAEDLLE
jgi:hypothetical protein